MDGIGFRGKTAPNQFMIICPLMLARLRVSPKNELKHEKGSCFYFAFSRNSCPKFVAWNIHLFPLMSSSLVRCELHVMILFDVCD